MATSELTLTKLKADIRKKAKPSKSKVYQSFFKTGKGEYGEGDRFLGLSVPQCHALASTYLGLEFCDIQQLLLSPYHEYRLIGLSMLVKRYKKSSEKNKKNIVQFYLKNRKYINNWDLVDLSAYHILGAYLLRRKKDILDKLARSKNMWDRRIAVVSTLAMIKSGAYGATLRLAQNLMHDKEDLMHKAVGWMLREVGKQDQGVLERFLVKHYKKMPRTMLRYAIERLNPRRRKAYLQSKI